MKTTGTFKIYDGYLCYHSNYAGGIRTIRLIDIKNKLDVTNRQGSDQYKNKAKRELKRYFELNNVGSLVELFEKEN